MIANEVVDLAKKKGKYCVLFKVDFEKAYDKVNWNFLRSLLKKTGFGEGWRKWMEFLFFSSKMSVLVNGSPTKKFVVERGLRQGDPLSPFLFVLVTQALSMLVSRAVDIGLYKGFDVKGK
ncbi:unnamed protein product [Vicia faba]|uniref:Reverse transcriptase domain-containing protein n=1 Tax=Vicia faba TaxID=3906 RepID=A0AAV0ZR68_VICFA|nr:unnamed protein product [Vicia faba]